MREHFSISVVSLIIGALVGCDYTARTFDGKSKNDDCQQVLILRAHECKPYYLTTEEIKLIQRLGE